MTTKQVPFGILPEGPMPRDRLCDTTAFVVYCGVHKRMAVACHPISKVIWLPFTMGRHTSWTHASLASSYIVLAGQDTRRLANLRKSSAAPYQEAHLMEVLRIQLPDQTGHYITRLLFYARLKSEFCQCFKQPPSVSGNNITWLQQGDLTPETNKPVWSHEVVNFRMAIPAEPQPGRILKGQMVLEFSKAMAMEPISRNSQLFSSAHIAEPDVERVYLEFLEHCLPAFGMTLCSFKQFMEKHDYEMSDSKLMKLFKAFNTRNNGHLSFYELAVGLVLFDPNTSHGSSRISFVFSYYDKQRSGNLREKDYTQMIRDMMAPMRPRPTPEQFLDRVRQCRQVFGLSPTRLNITREAFEKAVQEHNFRGTTALVRSNRSLLAAISRAHITRKAKLDSIRGGAAGFDTVCPPKLYAPPCAPCKGLKYVPRPIVSRLKGKLQGVGFRYAKNLQNVPCEDPEEPESEPEHYAAQLLRELRDFNDDKGDCRDFKGYLHGRGREMKDIVSNLTQDLVPIFEASVRTKLVHVTSPCYIIGDIHGNIEDLLTLEERLWARAPLCPNLLFLGDYVDRGRWGMECILYLLALKVLYKHKVTLLRGNHEFLEVQNKYSFRAECEFKYGEEFGEEIFNQLNYELFAIMPFVAIVDDAIFCAHGGIPRAAQKLIDIGKGLAPARIITRDDSDVAWEIVWSDPINDAQFEDVCRFFEEQVTDAFTENGGFVRNSKRGTAWFFSEEAADKFFAANGLTHIVRAHEVPGNGFSFYFGDKCCTIFSSSHYANNNKCAVIFAKQEKLRALVIDTDDNAPSFEPQ